MHRGRQPPSRHLYGTIEESFDEGEVPLPLKLHPLLKRLQDNEELSAEQILAILFIIRVADAMHRCMYASFLIRSFVDELCKKLSIADLDFEIEVGATRWSHQQGRWMTYHRLAADYDGSAMQTLSKIALGVLEDSLTVEQALGEINDLESDPYTGLERAFREFPMRILILPLLSTTGSVVYFHGTLSDMLVCAVTGLVAGTIHWVCSTTHPQLGSVQDLLVSMTTAMISVLSLTLLPSSTCFSAQILGTLFWFLYGISFMLSLYEMTQNLILTGLTRFAVAILNSFVLAFGVVIGVWMAAYGGADRFQLILGDCQNLKHVIDPIWYTLLYPLLAVGALMQMRVAPRHWPVCLFTQLVAVKSQFWLDVRWHQPMFVFNFLPAFLATLTAHVAIVVGNRFNWTKLKVQPTAYAVKKPTHHRSISEPLPVRNLAMYQNPTLRSIRFLDYGWADEDEAQHTGYRRNDRFQYQRSDLWFCLIPALYLLVPGSSVWKFAFFSIVDAAFDAHPSLSADDTFSLQSLISGVFVVGMGQVIGVRLALATLWAVTAVCSKRERDSSSSNGQ